MIVDKPKEDTAGNFLILNAFKDIIYRIQDFVLRLQKINFEENQS